MKPILSSYLDYQDATLNTQLELLKKLNLSHFMIRKIGGKRFYELSDIEIENYVALLKSTKVIAIDPLMDAFDMKDIEEVHAYNNTLEFIVSKAKKFKPTYYVYTIPKFNDKECDYKLVLHTVKEQLKIIKKQRLKVLIKFSDGHTPKIYRYIFDELNIKKNVEIMFDYVYLYKLNQAEITAFRILRNRIGMLIMDDIDKSGAGRVIGSGENIAVADIVKRFIKRQFSGYVVLDSSLIDLLNRANDKNWFSKMVLKKSKHELKIYNDFIERYRSTDTYRVLRIQMAIISLMFLNKKITLE